MSLSGQPVSGSAPKAVLTGPSGGLGSVFLDELCGAGWQVLAVSRNAHRLQAPPGVVAVDVDLSNASAVKAFISDHRDWLEAADVVINNAGSGILGAAHLQAQSAFEQQVQLMLQSPVALCLAVLPRMLARCRGTILNVTSLAGATGIPYMAAYTTAKAGLSAFTRSLQLEHSGSPVQIIEWCPGDIRSDFNQALQRLDAPAVVWQKLEAYMAKAPCADILRPAFRALLNGKCVAPVYYPGRSSQVVAALFASRLLPRNLLLRAVRNYYGLS